MNVHVGDLYRMLRNLNFAYILCSLYVFYLVSECSIKTDLIFTIEFLFFFNCECAMSV